MLAKTKNYRPSDKEPFMNERQREYFRRKLLAWKNDITAGYRGDSVRATQAHFISCLKSGAAFESGGSEYLRTFAAVEAAYRSAADGRCVPLSEILPSTLA